MNTFRMLFDEYIAANPSHIRKTELDIIQKCRGSFKQVENETYELIPGEVLDLLVNSMLTDFARTKVTFIIRELDRFAANKVGKDNITHSKLEQSEAIYLALTNNQAFVNENIRIIAMKKDGEEQFTFGYKILSRLIDKEGKTSKSQVLRLRWAASKFEDLFNTPFDEVTETDINKALSKCSESATTICYQLLNLLYVRHLVWKEAING